MSGSRNHSTNYAKKLETRFPCKKSEWILVLIDFRTSHKSPPIRAGEKADLMFGCI